MVPLEARVWLRFQSTGVRVRRRLRPWSPSVRRHMSLFPRPTPSRHVSRPLTFLKKTFHLQPPPHPRPTFLKTEENGDNGGRYLTKIYGLGTFQEPPLPLSRVRPNPRDSAGLSVHDTSRGNNPTTLAKVSRPNDDTSLASKLKVRDQESGARGHALRRCPQRR